MHYAPLSTYNERRSMARRYKKRAPRHTPEEWREIIKDFEEGSRSLSSYVRKLGVTEETFEKWHRRYSNQRMRSPDSIFVEVPKERRQLALEIHHGAYSIHLPDDYDPKKLKIVLQTLGELDVCSK
jgi:transposase-like protein